MYTDKWKMTIQTMGVRKLEPNIASNKAVMSSDTADTIHNRNIGNKIVMYDSEIQLHLHMLQINDTKTTMK
jgi:hypothetical protein